MPEHPPGEHPPGEHPLCRLDDIPDGEARGFTVGTGGGKRIILVTRRGGEVYAYVNACPHIGAPLDWTPNRFMSHDGRHLLCAMHGALFRVEDGYCVSGPCAGQRLAAVAVVPVDGQVFLRE